MIDTRCCSRRTSRLVDIWSTVRSREARQLRADNLAEFKEMNARCVRAADSDLTGRKFAAIGGTRSHVENLQRFAREIGVVLEVTGELDAWTIRFAETFQGAMAYGEYWDQPLVVDGLPGPATSAAVDVSRAAGWLVTTNFGWYEYVTKNQDRVPSKNNPVLMLDRELAMGMQRLRTFYGFAITILSGFRDKWWNAFVGGATSSQHLLGKACDFLMAGGVVSEDVARRWFNGVGIFRFSGRVGHVDVRSWFARWFYNGA